MDPTLRPDGERRTLGELFRSLTADATQLIQHEVALARAEMAANVRAVAAHAGMVVGGATLAAVGALVLVEALIFGLGALLGYRYWLSSLIVGALLLAIGGALAFIGIRAARGRQVAPERAITELRATGEWARVEAAGLRAALTGGAEPVAPAPAVRIAASPATPAPAAPLWKRVAKQFGEDDLPNQAAKVAYYFFLSLPPLVMAIFAMAGIFGGEATADWIAGRLQGMLPGEASALVGGFVDDVVREEHPGPLSIGLLLALWAASNVFMALEDTLNATYGIREKRGFVPRRLVALGTLVAVGVLFTAGSGALLLGPAISSALGLGALGETLWTLGQWPLAFALVVGAFWIIYYVLPLRDQRGCKGVLLRSSAIAAALWLLATVAFRVYITNFGSYSATYGLLGTVIVLLLWMYVTSLVILLGGEISSEMISHGGTEAR
ncbi:MAG TPA: YhjD/YihY/BrkB family envelope integrity protein, partial [Longimicrobium sp.]